MRIVLKFRVQDENVWLTQSAISQLFNKVRTTITEHLKNIFEVGELDENSVCREFRRTAAEVIVNRANYVKEHMGLATWKNAPHGKIVKADVSVAKNYLSVLELKDLNQVVSMYLDYAERQARKRIPMTMEDWANKLNVFLDMNDEKILSNAGSVSHEIAKSFAESEFEQYSVLQDKIFESDFDKLIRLEMQDNE